jgi:hypothetical protein
MAVNLSVYQIVPFNRDAAFIIATPAAMLVLAYLAFGPAPVLGHAGQAGQPSDHRLSQMS